MYQNFEFPRLTIDITEPSTEDLPGFLQESTTGDAV
jgi:hypothetical protein